MPDKFGYKVNIRSYCTHSEREPEQFGSWSESYDNSFIGIHKNPKGGYPDVVSELDIAPGEEVWVVWLEYSTGDSFGWSDRGGTETIAVFREYSDAERLQKELEKKTEYEFGSFDNLENLNKIHFETSYGEVIDIHTGTWCGYFERLDNVHIEKTWMIGEKDG